MEVQCTDLFNVDFMFHEKLELPIPQNVVIRGTS